MKILEIGFTDGPSIKEAVSSKDQFRRIEFERVFDFILADIPLLKVDLLLLFPKCNTFSMAAVSKHWEKDDQGFFQPRTAAASMSLVMLKKFEVIIQNPSPQFWYLENPKGLIHKFWNIGIKSSISHCQYGSDRMKPTYIFSNFNWQPKPSCHRGDPCHVSAPRSSSSGTQARKRSKRAELPLELQKALINSARLAMKE